jgi:hypothetical protein
VVGRHECGDDLGESLAAPGRPPTASVGHERVRVLGNLGAEVVEQAPQSALLLPTAATQLQAMGGASKGSFQHPGSYAASYRRFVIRLGLPKESSHCLTAAAAAEGSRPLPARR